MKKIAILFARKNSIYNILPMCDVFDEKRDALTFSGNEQIVAHPPCRKWSRLRYFSTAPESEKELARKAVWMVRKNGGILEHPAHSTLWKEMRLPLPGEDRDLYQGFTLSVKQFWWGHKADKATWLYICKYPAWKKLPPIPFVMGYPNYTCSKTRKKSGYIKKEITKAEREATPIEFAKWLCEVARGCIL